MAGYRIMRTPDTMTEEDFLAEMRELISNDKLPGLFPVMRTKTRELMSYLRKI